ncbi:MAG: glycosyltransferase [bacterium]|nr:glycosyltransferase [bacterium]
MRILYLSPEHISGTLSIYKTYHTLLGDECQFMTMFQNVFGFEDEICLNLPFSPTKGLFAFLKEFRRRLLNLPLDPERPTPKGFPPKWQADDLFSSFIFRLRELIWTPILFRLERKYNLFEFDLYQLDMGLEFYRDGRWVKKLKKMGKHFIAFYHGTDVRNRGVIEAVDDLCDLHLTSELDLLTLHPKLRYLYLPIDLTLIQPIEFDPHPKVFRIGHAARNRRLKGTETVIQCVEKLQQKGYPIELILIENTPHPDVIHKQKQCHLAIDQLTDLGGWGYGMSSLEFMALGIPVITKMRKEYELFLPDHPFFNTENETLETILEKVIYNADLRYQKRQAGFTFLEKYHAAMVVMRQLYDYYLELGWIQEIPKPLQSVSPPPVRLSWLSSL